MPHKPEAQETQCPNCGCRYDLPYQPIERQILKAIARLERNSGKATTNGIAAQLYLSYAQTYRHLVKLESRGEVVRIGAKGGWRKAA